MKKPSFLLLAFALFGKVNAQNINFTFNHLALSVKNLDESATFAVSDMAKAKARLEDPALKKIMTDAGVISEPVFEFYTSVE